MSERLSYIVLAFGVSAFGAYVAVVVGVGACRFRVARCAVTAMSFFAEIHKVAVMFFGVKFLVTIATNIFVM